MLGGLMKNLPVAMRESLDKMKGSMLLSMAKGMTSKDAETMARHWGYMPPSKAEPVKQIFSESLVAKTVIPDRQIPDRRILTLPDTGVSGVSSASIKHADRVNDKSSQLEADQSITASKAETPVTNQIKADSNLLESNAVTPPLKADSNILPSNAESLLADDESLSHPVFGKKIASLGYKNVYLTSVASLAKTQVWERQRTLRPDRAARIATSKITLGRTGSLSGVITMFCDKLSGRSGIVDGQHRAGALMLLSQEGHWDGQEQNILIDVFETESDDQIVALFKEINSAEPVRLVDMPGEGASAEVKDIIDSSMSILQSDFAEMFKISLKCKPPHLHEAIFRDDIFQSEVIERRGLKSGTDLLKLITAVNDTYSKRSDEEWEKILLDSKVFKAKSKLLNEAVKKARANHFFLGLDSSWMHSP